MQYNFMIPLVIIGSPAALFGWLTFSTWAANQVHSRYGRKLSAEYVFYALFMLPFILLTGFLK